MSDSHADHGHDHRDNGASDGTATHDPGAHERNRLSEQARRVYAMRALLIEKGVVTDEEIQRQAEYIETRSPLNGARLIARAWVDPAFKERLIGDPKGACSDLGIDATSMNEFVVVENSPTLRNLVVCTLCSCYPRPILGRPPDWYKSFNYRSRAVVEPRGVMREFGTEVPDQVEVRVHDSTADIRYLVIPERPAGTDGWSEEELATLVTRDSLIGVSDPLSASAPVAPR